jgi:putative photosynthetic complex assembly protein 2
VMEIGLPILFAIFLWWFSTGAILYLDGRPSRTFAISMASASVIAVLAIVAIWWTRGETSVTSAYVAFTAALLLWGWNEMAFLMGYVTGTRRVPANPRSAGWQRFREAAETIITHEIAIAITGVAIALICWGTANMVAFWTFLVLWMMRLSTKLNIYLGAPNVADEFLPPHLAYLSSYFRRRPMNGFFPLAISASTLVTAWLIHKAVWAQGSPFEVTAYSLLATLMALAVLEHWLLFIPLPTSWLWRWGLKNRAAPQPVTVNTSDLNAGGVSRRSG